MTSTIRLDFTEARNLDRLVDYMTRLAKCRWLLWVVPGGRGVIENLDEFAAQRPSIERALSLPDQFNGLLGCRGWHAAGVLDPTAMIEACRLAGAGQLDEAEAALVDAHSADWL